MAGGAIAGPTYQREETWRRLPATVISRWQAKNLKSVTLDQQELKDLENWNKGLPLSGIPRKTPRAIPVSSDTEVVAHPYRYRVTPKSTSGVDRWRNPEYHADCAATVLTYAANLVGFTPAAGLQDISEKFNQYIAKATTFPGFFLERNEQSAEHVTSTSIDLMVKDIVTAYQGYGSGDVASIVTSVEKMAESILNKSSKSSDKSVFSQDTVTKVDSYYYVTIFYVNLSMKVQQSGKKTLIDQRYRINRSLLKINQSYFIAYAEKLESMVGDGGLDDWGKKMSSPTGTRRSCLADKTADLIKELEAAEKEV
ncbi:hypothetical protein DFQ27_004764 [Actinomortierella ambigua]|uniref:Uncharacterized protein n=1 Tax=Actinomortierella ambigua TaxID=1343610 RepID=A0A9P6U3Z7_9FUNG|nr:hypothetical protein DFQ27_004764 [Actinomortierella ambigua]